MEKISIKEACVKALKEMPNGGTALDIYENIIEKKYYDFGKAKTPYNTVNATLGEFITKGDNRVYRIKNEGEPFRYFSAEIIPIAKNTPTKAEKKFTYHERDLHPLLCTYLRSQNILAKTILHEKSNKNDDNQKWNHPDIVGVRFVDYKTQIATQLSKAIKSHSNVEFMSYELKKEINSDYELKKCFFQAVSNSSWATRGYLVSFEINRDLREEIERLNDAFGIGVILLKANPFESVIMFEAKKKELDFRTLDKLCNINDDFKGFFTKIENVLTAESKFAVAVKKDLDAYCDKVLNGDTVIQDYCKEHNIPVDEDTNYQ